MAPGARDQRRPVRLAGQRVVAPVLAALAMLATAIGAANAADFGDGADASASLEFARIYADPNDIAANLAYAEAAEARGELRIALATYERLLVNFPDNREALEGLSRVRRKLEPDFTNWTVSIGGGYNSNPLQLPDAADPPGSGFGILDVRLRDDRSIGDARWRTRAYAGGILLDGVTSAVNTAYFGGDVGPVFQVSPRYDLRVSLEGAYRALEAGTLYGEVGGALEFEGFQGGATQAGRLRVVYRSYGDAFVSDAGVVVDLDGRFGFEGLLSDRDTLVIRPHGRYSGVDGTIGSPVVPFAFTPGEYFEGGGRVDYDYLINPYVIVGANISGFYRAFTEASVPGGPDTRDWYLAPGAKLIFTNFVSDSIDLRFDYEHQLRRSNDATRDFDADVIAGRAVFRF